MNNSFKTLDCRNCSIRCQSIFSEIDTELVLEIDGLKDSTLVKKGQIIFNEGVLPKGIYIIHSGKVKVSKFGSNARDQIIRFARIGDVIGYRSLISGQRYFATATALEDSIICFIPKAEFFSLLETEASISKRIIKLLSIDLANAENRMTEIVQKPVSQRMAEALLILKEIYGTDEDSKTLSVLLTREDLANYVGTTTETCIRILSEFKKQGYIRIDKRQITLLDVDGLIKESHIND